MNAAVGNRLSLPPAYRLIALEAVESTQIEAKRLAAEGAEDGTLVWAKSQSAGRGRRGQAWASPEGNLYLSLVMRPECPPAEAAQLGFAAALALGDAIGTVGPPMLEVLYKWPNDVLLNERKVAGFLLESHLTPERRLEWLVLGLGANVVSHPKDAEFPATDLRFEGSPAAVTAEALLEAFARHYLAWVNCWLEEGFAPLRRRWLSHAWRLGETIEARLQEEVVRGTFETLDQDGQLRLALPEGGTRTIAAGRIFGIE